MSLNRTDDLEEIFPLTSTLKETNLVSGDIIYVSHSGDTTAYGADSGGSILQSRSTLDTEPKLVKADMASSSSRMDTTNASVEAGTIEHDAKKLLQSVNELLHSMPVGSKSELIFVILNQMMKFRGFRPVSSKLP